MYARISLAMGARATLRRLPHLALVLALAGPGAGCGRLFGAWDLAPNGLTREDDRVRRMLADGQAGALDAALQNGRLAPQDDPLLADLYQAVAAYYGGRPDVSAALLDSAAYLAEDRQTRSISRAAASVLSSDRVLEWIPAPTERLLVPYYAALARLARGDAEGAAVEARRLSALLEAEEDVPAEGVALRAALRYVAGAIFERAGQHNDAAVAYRNAAALAVGVVPAADSTALAAGEGEVLVVLEQGFVAHRVERSFTVLLDADEIHALADGDAGERLAAATLVAGRVLLGELGLGDGRGRGRDQRHASAGRAVAVTQGPAAGGEHRVPTAPATAPADSAADAGDEERRSETPYILRVAWPAYAAPARPAASARVEVAAGSPAAITLGGDVSASLMADFERDRLALVAKTLARAAAKAAVSRGVEKEVAEQDETAGAILGLLTNVGTALLERADTRGWNLLPGQVGLARLRLPAGDHDLRVRLAGGEVLELGTVSVADGGLTLVPARAW